LADLADLANQARPTAKISGQNFIGIWPRPMADLADFWPIWPLAAAKISQDR